MIGIIYKYTSPSNKVYIGQTLNEYYRKAMWKNTSHPYAGPYINNARAKYGYENFKYEVLASIDSDDEVFLRKEVDRLEEYFIELYDSTNPKKGYNITPGGLGHKGNKDAVISPQCREACIRANTGRKQSEETKRKRFLSNPRHKKVDCYDINGNFVKTFFCLKYAAEELHLKYQAIQRVLNGKRHSTGGYIFKYHRE